MEKIYPELKVHIKLQQQEKNKKQKRVKLELFENNSPVKICYVQWVMIDLKKSFIIFMSLLLTVSNRWIVVISRNRVIIKKTN